MTRAVQSVLSMVGPETLDSRTIATLQGCRTVRDIEDASRAAGAVLALDAKIRLHAIGANVAAPPGVRANALGRLAALGDRARDDGAAMGKQPHEMTAEELRAEIARLELARAQTAGRIRDVVDDEADGIFG